jgi:hypothetical protein
MPSISQLTILSKCSLIFVGFLDVKLAAGFAAEEVCKVQPQNIANGLIAVPSDVFS